MHLGMYTQAYYHGQHVEQYSLFILWLKRLRPAWTYYFEVLLHCNTNFITQIAI